MNPRATLNRFLAALKLAIVTVLRPFRKLAARILQVAEHSEIRQLRNETARLSAASVESVTYLSGEVRQLDQRLAQLEEELTAIRRLLEDQAAPDPDRSESASRSAASSA